MISLILPQIFCKNTVTHSFCGASFLLKCMYTLWILWSLTLWSSWSWLLGNYDVKALNMTTWQHTICCLWPSLKCLKCSHASVNLFFWCSILCDLTSVLRSWLAFQMFVCSASCHQFKNQRHTHSTHRWTKIHCLSLACPAVSASVRWHTRLNRASECFFFFFVVQWLADSGFPGSHCSVGGSEAICSLLCVFAQSASLCLSVVRLPPQCQMLLETSLACSEGCHSVHTMPDCCLLLFVSETAQRSHGGLQMYCIFSRMCVTAVAMQLLLPVGTWWGVSLLNDGRNSLFYSQTIQRSVTSDVLGFRPLSWLWERVL